MDTGEEDTVGLAGPRFPARLKSTWAEGGRFYSISWTLPSIVSRRWDAGSLLAALGLAVTANHPLNMTSGA